MADETDNLVLRLLREFRAEHMQDRRLLLQVVDLLRRMEQRLETRIGAVEHNLEARIGAVEQRLESRISAVDQRLAELRDDLEILLKSEIMGSQTNFEIKFDQRLQEIEDRLKG